MFYTVAVDGWGRHPGGIHSDYVHETLHTEST